MKIILAGCVKSKRPGSHPATELYDSALFRGRRAYAEANADRWYILSAHYGLVRPDEVLDWYEQSMASLSRAQRREWSQDVLRAIDALEPNLAGVTVELHAGAEYLRWGLEAGLRERGAEVVAPLANVPGLGTHIRWYANRTA